MQAIQNLGMALITMMSGWVVDKMGYLWLEYFFIFWLAIALMCTLVIWVCVMNSLFIYYHLLIIYNHYY